MEPSTFHTLLLEVLPSEEPQLAEVAFRKLQEPVGHQQTVS